MITNKTHKIIKQAVSVLSILLGFGVMATGAHLKDVSNYAFDLPHGTSAALEVVKKYENVSQNNMKVMAELHNHIEKQTYQSMVKNITDDTNRSRQLKRAVRNARLRMSHIYVEPATRSWRQLFQRALGLA